MTERQTVSEQKPSPSAALTLFPVAVAALLCGLALAYSANFNMASLLEGSSLFATCIGMGLCANGRCQVHWKQHAKTGANEITFF